MQKKIKTKTPIKFTNIAVIAVFIILFIIFAYSYKGANLAKDLLSKKNILFSLIISSDQESPAQKLDAFMIYYERQSNVLKVLAINTDTVVVRKKSISSFKTAFNSNIKTNRQAAFKNFYEDLQTFFGNINPNYLIHINYETAKKLFPKDNMTKEFFAKTTYTYDDIEYMNRLRITQNILKTLKSNTVSSILKILSNHGYIRTNITRFSFISMFIRFKFSNIKIIFYEMPSKQDAENFMTNVYFAPLNFNLSTKDGFLEIQNASQKPKIAYNATMFLREEGFDVLDWSNSANNYKETLIKEYSGDYGYALALAKIFKTKDILIAYNGQTYYKATIFIGEDFPIEKFQTKDNIRKN